MLALVSPAAGAQPAEGPDYSLDQHGRRMRVRFDPGNQLTLGVLGGMIHEQGAWEPATVLRTEIAFRNILRFDEDDEQIQWQLDHRFVQTSIRLDDGSLDLPAGRAVLFDGSYLRHTDSPSLMLPTSPPRRMFFPFDVGLHATVGGVDVPKAQTQQLTVQAVHAAVLFDPLRSSQPGTSVELGLGVHYDLDVGLPLSEGSVVHRVAPFTAASIRVRYQDDPGRTVLDAGAAWLPHWASEGGWTTRDYEARFLFAHTLLAANDEPIAATVETGAAHHTRGPDGEATTEYRLLAGLCLGLQFAGGQ